MNPPRNCTITLREPFLRPVGDKFHIKACIDNNSSEQELTIKEQQHLDILRYLTLVDKKLTSAVIRVDALNRFVVLRHSPMTDFFHLVDKA